VPGSRETVCDAVDVQTGDGVADALFAHPVADGPHPAVVLYTDAYGIRAAVEAHVRRLAAGGYAVLAPNVFYRSGRAPVFDDIEERLRSGDRSELFALLRPKMAALTPDVVNADANAWLEFVRGRPEVSDGPVGTVGYCMGGRMALRMAGAKPGDVAAAASFHGGNLVTDERDSPHLAAVQAQGELYVGHADNDGSMPPEQMARLTQVLAEAHVRHTAELYVGAAHGWTQADTHAYDEASSERHWMRLLELFGRVLAD
jgi:carboxymethylenebutenolidase